MKQRIIFFTLLLCVFFIPTPIEAIADTINCTSSAGCDVTLETSCEGWSLTIDCPDEELYEDDGDGPWVGTICGYILVMDPGC